MKLWKILRAALRHVEKFSDDTTGVWYVWHSGGSKEEPVIAGSVVLLSWRELDPLLTAYEPFHTKLPLHSPPNMTFTVYHILPHMPVVSL